MQELPPLIPMKPGARVKTDRRNATMLARLHRAESWRPSGCLTPITGHARPGPVGQRRPIGCRPSASTCSRFPAAPWSQHGPGTGLPHLQLIHRVCRNVVASGTPRLAARPRVGPFRRWRRSGVNASGDVQHHPAGCLGCPPNSGGWLRAIGPRRSDGLDEDLVIDGGDIGAAGESHRDADLRI